MNVIPENLSPSHNAKQLRPKLAQDFAVTQESGTLECVWTKRFHSFGGRRIRGRDLLSTDSKDESILGLSFCAGLPAPPLLPIFQVGRPEPHFRRGPWRPSP